MDRHSCICLGDDILHISLLVALSWSGENITTTLISHFSLKKKVWFFLNKHIFTSGGTNELIPAAAS